MPFCGCPVSYRYIYIFIFIYIYIGARDLAENVHAVKQRKSQSYLPIFRQLDDSDKIQTQNSKPA